MRGKPDSLKLCLAGLCIGLIAGSLQAREGDVTIQVHTRPYEGGDCCQNGRPGIEICYDVTRSSEPENDGEARDFHVEVHSEDGTLFACFKIYRPKPGSPDEWEPVELDPSNGWRAAHHTDVGFIKGKPILHHYVSWYLPSSIDGPTFAPGETWRFCLVYCGSEKALDDSVEATLTDDGQSFLRKDRFGRLEGVPNVADNEDDPGWIGPFPLPDGEKGGFAGLDLDIDRLGDGTLGLRWRQEFDGHKLQQKSDGTGDEWEDVDEAPTVEDEEFRIILPAPPWDTFFRLIDAEPPVVEDVGPADEGKKVSLRFSEPVDEADALNPSHYLLSGLLDQVDIVGVTLSDPLTVELTVEPQLIPGHAYVLQVTGIMDIAGNTAAPSALLITPEDSSLPCLGGRLAALHAYSECNADGFWHVVVDHWYVCPDGSAQRIRVHDEKTNQPCTPLQAPPNAALLRYPPVEPSCTGLVNAGTVVGSVCRDGRWVQETYRLVECADGDVHTDGLLGILMSPDPDPCDEPAPVPDVESGAPRVPSIDPDPRNYIATQCLPPGSPDPTGARIKVVDTDGNTVIQWEFNCDSLIEAAAAVRRIHSEYCVDGENSAPARAGDTDIEPYFDTSFGEKGVVLRTGQRGHFFPCSDLEELIRALEMAFSGCCL